MGIPIEKNLGSHNHAVHAIATLSRLLFNKRLLQIVGMGAASQTLESGNFPALRTANRNAAGSD
jgi:hypothetical protein